MANIPDTPGRSGMPGVRNLRLGTGGVSANDLGAQNFQNWERLGRAIGMAVQELQQWGIKKYEDRAQTEQRNAAIAWQDEYEAFEREEMKKQGEDARSIDARLEEEAKRLSEKQLDSLTTPRAKELFQKSIRPHIHQSLLDARRYIDREDEISRVKSLDAVRGRLQRDVEKRPGMLEDAARQVAENIRDKYRGQSEEVVAENTAIEQAILTEKAVNSIGKSSPNEALKMLDDAEVKRMLGNIKAAEMRETFGKSMIADAKKGAENDMRQIGIQLGEQYDNEIEIERALDAIEDRELADIAKKYAKTRMEARAAMGKNKPITAEETARENRLSREQAASILAGADAENEDDDITDEESLDVALDEVMAEESEIRREKVRKHAIAQMKARKARQAQERRALDQEALKAMSAAGWSPTAINPDWPEDLQDKMSERAERHERTLAMREERAEKAARKAKGLEYLEMPLDKVNEKILAGGWLDIVDEVGGGTPEMSKLEKRIRGEDSGGLTALQRAKNAFFRTIGDPAKKANKKMYAEFTLKMDEARTAEAGRLKLDNPDMIPVEKQDEIINGLLARGDYGGFWSFDSYRFQEDSDAEMNGWKAFEQSVTPDTEFPDFAQPYFGQRDKKRQLLASGGVLIESGEGVITIINPDGTISDTISRKAK